MKKIPVNHFDALLQTGHDVPRDRSGNTMEYAFKVGKEYIIGNHTDDRTIKVRCSQDCPCNLNLIK